jgi:hypothetical protein
MGNLMLLKKYNALLFLLLLAVLSVAISCAIQSAKSSSNGQQPILYIAAPDGNSAGMLIAEPDLVTTESCLVITTHGWIERTLWSRDLALAIKGKVDSGKWICGWFDWRRQANRINPTDAAEFGKNNAGPMLGEEIVGLSKDWQHVHLIGHSAGTWVINEAAKIVAEETNATIHLTFLDAYVPPLWKEDELGCVTGDPNISCWSEHYFTRDITLGVTEKLLKHAHNVDLTDVTPGINDHKFPWHWYLATVTGQYAAGQRYEGRELFYRAGTIEYGFARSLEAGTDNWKTSTALKMESNAVKIQKRQE